MSNATRGSRRSLKTKNEQHRVEALDPAESAHEAGLRYVSDSKPGIRRLGVAKRFRYANVDGKAVRDKETLARIHSLVIPPAWTDVWISPLANGHLQAT